MEKLNLDQFILIQQQKHWQIIILVSKMLFKVFCTGPVAGLMKDLIGLLNKSSLNTLKFQSRDHYQEVLTCNCLLNQEVQKKS